jgi:hypothetical protein
MGIPGRATSVATILALVLLTAGAAAGSIATIPKVSAAVQARPTNSRGSLSAIPTPVPTSTPPPTSTTTTTTSPPSPAAAAAVALAALGQRLSYVATYDVTQTEKSGIDPVSLTVAQVGNPDGGWPTEWYYRLEWADGAQFELELQPGGVSGVIFRCGLQSPTSEWTCVGPTNAPGGNYGVSLVQPYEPMTEYSSLQSTLTDQADTASTALIAGQAVRCLTSSSQTWCLTSPGLFASFPADDQIGPYGGLAGELVAWSGEVTPEQFDLPATPSTTISPDSVCVHGGPC